MATLLGCPDHSLEMTAWMLTLKHTQLDGDPGIWWPWNMSLMPFSSNHSHNSGTVDGCIIILKVALTT